VYGYRETCDLSRFSQTGLVCDRFSWLALTRFVGLGMVMEFLGSLLVHIVLIISMYEVWTMETASSSGVML
jgi:hypothetical protein